MRLLRPLTLLFLAAVLFTGCATRMPTAAWVVRYDGDTPAEVDQVCTAAKTTGLDALHLQVRGRADAYYQSEIAPAGETITGGFNPLGATLKSCAPIPIHAWLNVYYLWSGEARPADSRHPAHPSHDWIIGDADGRKVSDYTEFDRALGWLEGLYADPAAESYRQLMAQVVTELVERYPVQGIHLDFIRYPGTAYGQTGPLGKRFEQEWGIDPRLLPVGVTRETIDRWLGNTMPPGESVLTTAALFWAEMRAQQVTAMVREIRTAIKKSNRPEATLSAAVFPDIDDAYLNRGQDSQAWAREGLVDSLYPMAYFGPAERVGGQLREIALHRAAGVQYWAGLGAYIKNPEQIAAEATTARDLDYDGIALFSLGHLLRKAEGVAPHVNALTDLNAGWMPQCRTAPARPPTAIPTELATLQRIVTTASGSLPPLPDGKLAPILQAKLAELAVARDHGFAGALAELRARPVTPPPWVELHGIFRYVHPLDPPEIRQRQQSEAIALRNRLLEGEEFKTLAKEHSQGGSRRLGGPLGRRFLDLAQPENAFLAELAPATISPVMPVENGYWLYLLDAKGQEKAAAWDTLPWPARRILFKRHVDRIMR
ncbi:MAG: family 10 glycosylhydrolase [Thermodesulfobacteriota bacterium]